ncbi:MAG: alpha/beta hydrolase family protein [Candidatus Hodarchaeota archaeon]
MVRTIRKVLAASIIVFSLGCTLMAIGTFNPDENLPIRISFNTYSRYSNELNSFFNRTIATPKEDAKNKLIENYRVAGYVVIPKDEQPIEGYPVIIWMHGFGVSSDIQINYARQFAKSGFFTIALDQPGHGWSGGYYDMGLETLLGVYSTIEWLIHDSAYKNRIDATRIGISGHSMGGIAATRAGIFDNWINPKSGNRVGTGRIKACCAIFCWDDASKMAEGIMENFGISQVWSNPTIEKMLTQWRWLSNHDPSIIKEEFRIRSVSNFINLTNTKNYCLIIGGDEHPATIEAECHIMANATIDITGLPQVTWKEINNEIHTAANHTWNFGNIKNNSARRLVLIPDTSHFEEAISFDVLQNITYWFNYSMDCGSISPEIPKYFQLPYFLKMGGWGLTFIGFLSALLPTFVSIADSRIGSRSLRAEIAPNLNTKDKKYLYAVYAVIPILLITISGFIEIDSITRFWLYDLFIIPRFLISALLLLIPILVTTFFEKKQYKYHYEDIGLGTSIENNLKSIFNPLIAICLWLLLFNSFAWIFQVPLLFPRPSELGIYLDFILLLGILLLFNFEIELLFRGLFQTKIQKNNEKWIIIGKSTIFSGGCLGIGFGTSLCLFAFGILIYQPILILVLYSTCICIFSILGAISAMIYYKTGNFLSSAIFNSILMVLFISGKIILVYA